MRRFRVFSAVAVLTVVTLSSLTAVLSQSQNSVQYPQGLLNQKSNFTRAAAAAMSEPFRGVATSAGIVEGLFPVRSTGVSTAAVRIAAENFLATLDSGELSRAQFAIDDLEWRNWSNVDVGIFARHGISLEETTAPQKTAAWDLLRVALSTEGLDQTEKIMRTEQALLEINGEPIRYGEEKYYLTFMGIPSVNEPRGFQLDGHHLGINFFVLGDQVVMTPAFYGGEPVFTETGKYAGNEILQEQQNLGLALMQSLSPSQQGRATIKKAKTGNDNQAEANRDNLTLDFEGIDLSSAQKLGLLEVVRSFVGKLRDPHAQVTMDEIGQHIDNTYFAWVGAAADDSVFYYRIHSPVILIEFDHENPVGTRQKNTPGTPTRDHIHTVVRTPNGNDYGKDLLAQHLATHPH